MGGQRKEERTLIISIHVGWDGAVFAAGFLAVALVVPFFAADIADDGCDDDRDEEWQIGRGRTRAGTGLL